MPRYLVLVGSPSELHSTAPTVLCCLSAFHALQRLAKARRVAAREAAAREKQQRAEQSEVAAVVESMLDSVGAAQAFEEEAAAAGDAGDSTGGSPRSRPRRHISLEYEADGPASPPPAAAGRAGGGKAQPRRGGEPGAAGKGAAAGGSSSGGGDQGSQSEAPEEPSPQELLSLEWLRDAPDDVARNYLMSIDGGCWHATNATLACHALLACAGTLPATLPDTLAQPNTAGALLAGRCAQAWAARAWPASCCSRWAKRSSLWTPMWAASAHGKAEEQPATHPMRLWSGRCLLFCASTYV